MKKMNIQDENQQEVVIPKSLYNWTIIHIISIIGISWIILLHSRIMTQDNPSLIIMLSQEISKQLEKKYGKFTENFFATYEHKKLDMRNYASHQEWEQAVCDEAIKFNREFGQYYCWKMKQIPNPEVLRQPPVFESTTEMLEMQNKLMEKLNQSTELEVNPTLLEQEIQIK